MFAETGEGLPLTNTHDDVSFLQSSTHGGVRFTLAILHNVDTIDKVQRFNHSCDRSTHTSQSVEPSPVATKFHTGFVMRYSNNNNTALDELFVVACLGFIRCVRLAWCNRAIVGASVVFLVLSYWRIVCVSTGGAVFIVSSTEEPISKKAIQQRG